MPIVSVCVKVNRNETVRKGRGTLGRLQAGQLKRTEDKKRALAFAAAPNSIASDEPLSRDPCFSGAR